MNNEIKHNIREYEFYFDKETMILTFVEKVYVDFYNALTGETDRYYGEPLTVEIDVNNLPKKEKTNE